MKIATTAALLAAAMSVVSCDRRETKSADVRPALVQPESKHAWSDSDFTPWMSRAELQYRQENNPADQYFARVEGRDNGGMMEYRAVIKTFPSDQYDQWAVFWGIDEKELFDWELKLLKSGFAREEMQIFADAGGNVYHQIVWLKPMNRSASIEEPALAVTSEQVIQEQAKRSEPAPVPAPAPEPVVAPEPAPEPEPAPAPEPVVKAPAPEPEMIPVPAPAAPVVQEEPVAAEPEPAPKIIEEKPVKKAIYSVKPGDTLGKIAKQKGVTVADLKAANSLKGDVVKIGQKLVIPAKQ
ncbi:MAG TPA: LysM peptidoglycan-binding domain-containing protein [Luteolibacter sp.]|nr:LysM peptidoglycan-binding domain-containing protein [Luteolibacter sp.]